MPIDAITSNPAPPTFENAMVALERAGTSVKRDIVEFPSQFKEHWLRTPEVLNRFARHHWTGQPIPPELLAAVDRSRYFNEGFATAEYLTSAIYDMKIHLKATEPDPACFAPPRRHRPPERPGAAA